MANTLPMAKYIQNTDQLNPVFQTNMYIQPGIPTYHTKQQKIHKSNTMASC